jgi:hypothetical protein
MEKLTDQELDALFKAAAEGINPEYEVAAWEGMNAKLDAAAKSPFTINRWIPLAIIGLIIFSSGVWLGYRLSSTSSGPDLKNKTEIRVAESKIVNDENLAAKSISSQKSVVSNDTEKKTQSENQNSTTDQNQSLALAETKQNAKDDFSEKKDVKNENLDVDQEVKIIDLQESKFKNVSNLERAQDAEELILVESKTDSITAEEVTPREKSDSTHVSSENNKDEDKKARKNNLFIRGLASPDFTAINFGSSGKAGSNYALLIEYQFAKRWWVSTGAIRSFKKYSSNGEITYSGRAADNLDGACRILDIPLNIYYQLRPLSKTSFFGSVGLSSYIMLSEDYKYTIYTNSGDRVYAKLVEKENNEWFKVLNLSVGIQRQLNSRFYLQAEPFLKAPLAGVGYGDVRLSSLGVFFGMKYKLY